MQARFYDALSTVLCFKNRHRFYLQILLGQPGKRFGVATRIQGVGGPETNVVWIGVFDLQHSMRHERRNVQSKSHIFFTHLHGARRAVCEHNENRTWLDFSKRGKGICVYRVRPYKRIVFKSQTSRHNSDGTLAFNTPGKIADRFHSKVVTFQLKLKYIMLRLKHAKLLNDDIFRKL